MLSIIMNHFKILRASFIALAAGGAMALTGFDGCHSPTQAGKTDTVTLKTGPDTTSHNWAWTLSAIADMGTLKGVWVFDDTTIYVVGDMYLHDSESAPNEPIEYTLAKWNGNVWTYYNLDSSIGYISPALGLFGFSKNDYWYMDGAPAHWIGPPTNRWIGYNLNSLNLPRGGGDIMNGWGASSTDMYFALGDYVILHFDGYNFQQINTGTNLVLRGIWGGLNPKTGKDEVICVASNEGIAPLGNAIFSVNGTSSVTQLVTKPMNDSASFFYAASIWFSPGNKYYVGGSQLWWKTNIYDTTAWNGIPLTFGVLAICGPDTNDLLFVGGQGGVEHYNGSTFQNYPSLTVGNYYSVSMNGNTACAVGEEGNGPIVLMGKRQ